MSQELNISLLPLFWFSLLFLLFYLRLIDKMVLLFSNIKAAVPFVLHIFLALRTSNFRINTFLNLMFDFRFSVLR